MDTTKLPLGLLISANLPTTIVECHELIGQLSNSLQEIVGRIAALEEQIKLNSRNSSKTPSSDCHGQRGNRAKRSPSARKRGGQPGVWDSVERKTELSS